MDNLPFKLRSATLRYLPLIDTYRDEVADLKDWVSVP